MIIQYINILVIRPYIDMKNQKIQNQIFHICVNK